VLGLYVHVPFCASICNYCNFTRGLFDESLKTRFVDALSREIQGAAAAHDEKESLTRLPADTIYFGGGTPSLLTPNDIGSIIDTARASFALAPDAEITLEANPETVDTARLEGFRRAGINRLSYGVQSFSDDELKRLGRLHSAERAEDAVRMARAAGFDNVSLDLMMWLPEQDVAQWLSSVEKAIAVAPEHMSLYILEVYPHLPLKQEIDLHRWTQVEDEAAAEMYESSMAMLDGAGYEQYEISNVAKPGRQSLHNLKYWTDGEWWGFGPAAHSTWRGARWRNVASTDDYVRRIAAGVSVVAERRNLAADERLGDAVFTGLRLNRGVDLSTLSQRYSVDIWARFRERLTPFGEAGLLVKEGDCIRLTRQGMLMANEVMAVFV
jgi:putative oxygen-independent coproporphyrinogen III oxidase